MELMQTVRSFITFMKAHPSSREHFKANKLPSQNFNNKVNESEIYSSSLDQVQQVINEDADLVFNTLVAADYIDEIKCTDGSSQQYAWLTKKYNPDNYFTVVAEHLEIYNIDELGPTTGTVFQIFANNNPDLKINTLFDTGAMKSVMSFDAYQKLKLDMDINSTEEAKVKIIPDELWLSANPNICTYPMIADLKDRKQYTMTPFVIVNFSHHKYLHLPKDHVVAFTEKNCNESEVLEIGTMEELERDLPRFGYQNISDKKK